MSGNFVNYWNKFSLKRWFHKDSTNQMIVFLSFSNLFGNILTIISGFFVTKWILPSELGEFNTYTIITGYVILFQIGIPSGLSRELPFYLGKHNIAKAEDLARVSQFWLLLLSFTVIIISLRISLYFILENKYKSAFGVFTLSILVWQGLYVTKYIKTLYRTNKQFNRLSIIKIINSISAFITIYLVYKFGFYGLCMRAISCALIDFVFSFKWRPIKVKPKWNLKDFRELLRTGFPMYAVASVYGIWPLLQRSLILMLGGKTALGLFAIASMVESSMKTISSSLNSVIFPTITTKWGEGTSVENLVRTIIKPLSLSFIVLVCFVPIGYYAIPFVINNYLPNYVDGIEAGRWMLVAGLVSLLNVFSSIYNVLKIQKERLVVFSAGILSWGITVLISYVNFGFSLTIFPIGMIFGFCVMTVLNGFFLRKYWRFNSLEL